MKITEDQLKRIIIEEYIKEENLDEYSDEAEKLIKKMVGDKEYARRQALKNQGSRGGDTKPMKKPNKASDTMPFGPSDIPSDDAPERYVSGFQDRAGPDDDVVMSGNIEDAIYDMVKGADAGEVAEIFNAVFSRFEPEAAEEIMTSLYGGKEMDARQQQGRQVGFKLEELKLLIKKVLAESV